MNASMIRRATTTNQEKRSNLWRRHAVLLAVTVSLLAASQDGWAIIKSVNLGDQVAGTLSADQDVLVFYAPAGTQVQITAQPNSPLQIDVALSGPSGSAVAGLATASTSTGGTTISGQLPTAGHYSIVVAAANSTAGTYLLRISAVASSKLGGTGNVTLAGQQTISFNNVVPGAILSLLKIKAGAATLQLNQEGVLTDPDGAVVTLGVQKASGKMLAAANAVLTKVGLYSFKFTPEGTGSYTYAIKLKLPSRSTPNVVTLPSNRPPVPPASATGVSVQVSTPTNGTHFVSGEAAWVTVVFKDDSGNPLTLSQLSTANLYMYGPQETLQTTTAVNLLRAVTDRSKRPHHYIDLKTNPDVIKMGNVVMYPLSAVDSDPDSPELPGTYSVTCWAVLATDTKQQWFPVADCQIKTETAETQIVEKENCAKCHFGPISGKFYFHHIDPSSFAPNGNPGIDQWPVRTCKSCHNQDGYATYTDPKTGTKIVDPIVKRVHGIHNGEELMSPENIGNWLIITNVVGTFHTNDVVTGGTSGAFAQIAFVATNNAYLVVGDIDGTYTSGEVLANGTGATANLSVLRNGVFTGEVDYKHVVFPAEVLNCTKCHVDDRWKEKPSRQACGACHDNTWFGEPLATPAGWVNHHGGSWTNDNYCIFCHGPGQADDIAVKHQVPTPPVNLIDVTMTPPANGTYYVAGEAPVVTMVFKNDAGDSIGDHTVVSSNNFSTASLFVYGPRSRALPVLTSTADLGVDTKRATVTCATNGPWAINGKTFKIAINGSDPQEITIVGTNAAQVVASLNPVITNLNGGCIASVSGKKVVLKSLIRGANAKIEIYTGEVTSAMGWRARGVVIDPDVFVAAVSTPGNDLRAIPNADPLDFIDPRPTRTTSNITYQLDDVAGLTPGTYHIYVYYLPVATNKVAGIANPTGVGHMMFQVGTGTTEKKVATNCTDCHGNTIWHLYEGPIHAEPFDTDYCLACHDYSHPNTGDMFKNQGGTSVNGWSGFGAMPIVRRVHGVHRAHYLEHSEEIYANATKDTFGDIIFPQDIRNCTKCHAETDTWKQKPSRMACLACHDSDDAKAHGKLMTYIPDPDDPYGPTAVESCGVCHGEGSEFSADKVHSISNPYKPPYPRESE